MVRVNLRGFRAIDRRKVAARSAIEFRSALLADLGGEQALSAARLALVDAATRTWLYAQHLDAWCLEQTSLVNGRRKGVHPVVKERLLLVESLQRTLVALGLDRAQPKAKTLGEIAAEIEARRAEHLVTQEPPGAERAGSEPECAAEGVESAPGVSEPGQAGGIQAPESPMAGRVEPEPQPAEMTDAVAAVADQAARRVLGTWKVVEPEPAEMPEF